MLGAWHFRTLVQFVCGMPFPLESCLLHDIHSQVIYIQLNKEIGNRSIAPCHAHSISPLNTASIFSTQFSWYFSFELHWFCHFAWYLIVCEMTLFSCHFHSGPLNCPIYFGTFMKIRANSIRCVISAAIGTITTVEKAMNECDDDLLGKWK